MAHATITPEIENVLRASTVIGNALKLPAGQLDRKLYTDVNAVIENLGGKWNKSAKAHIFTDNPQTLLQSALSGNGVVRDRKKDLQAFFTPPEIGRIVVQAASVDGCLVLEPSAGTGNLADLCVQSGAKKVDCVEIDSKHCATLRKKEYLVMEKDFLTVNPMPVYDRVVMNPPFTHNADLKHVAHALKFIRANGRLVSVVMGDESRAPLSKFATENGGTIQPFGRGAFKSSGTEIATSMLTIDKS